MFRLLRRQANLNSRKSELVASCSVGASSSAWIDLECSKRRCLERMNGVSRKCQDYVGPRDLMDEIRVVCRLLIAKSVRPLADARNELGRIRQLIVSSIGIRQGKL